MLDTSQGVTPQFALGEDQLAVREMARAFAIEVFAPHALAWDEAKHFPVAEMRKGRRARHGRRLRQSPMLAARGFRVSMLR